MKTISVLALLFTAGSFALACGSSATSPADTSGGSGSTGGGGSDNGSASCPRNGVVPADLRDVERAGEGLVTTTFGDAKGNHAPDWTRANSVLAVLKQVWGRTKAACPGLPTDAAKAIDDAIASIDTAIPAKDQKTAVLGANAVGLAVPDLYDYFHPDAPKAIVRMDAVFRQVGIDAIYKTVADVTKDVQSLRSDWQGSKTTIQARVPTCHRVGGTANVSGDIETSLASLNQAIAKNDTKTIVGESENGALEIDTLELLFDCPPDNVAPSKGLGAMCADVSSCDAGQVCDTGALGGKCAPDPKTAKIGTACQSTIDCGSDARAACLTEAGDMYPGGYCGMEPCDDVHVCPPGATCVSIGGETPGCFQSCKSDSDCRFKEGYVCQVFLTAQPIGYGPSDHACAFPCTDDSQCHTLTPDQCAAAFPMGGCPKLKCDVGSGKCTP